MILILLSFLLLELLHFLEFKVFLTYQLYLRNKIRKEIELELENYSPLWKIRRFFPLHIRRENGRYSAYVEFKNIGIENCVNAMIYIENGKIVDSRHMLAIMTFESIYGERNQLKNKEKKLRREKKLDALGI